MAKSCEILPNLVTLFIIVPQDGEAPRGVGRNFSLSSQVLETFLLHGEQARS